MSDQDSISPYNIYMLFAGWEVRMAEGSIFLKLDEILSKRTRMILGCKYGKIFHKLNSFWASKW